MNSCYKPVATKHRTKPVIQALTRDPHAFRLLVACTLAIVATAAEPPFLTLSTPDIQSQLRAPNSSAPLTVAVLYFIVALVTLIGGTSGDLFGRRLVLLVGLVGVTLSDLIGMFTLGTPIFGYADAGNVLSVSLVVPMTVAIVTLAFPRDARPFAFGILFGFQALGFVLSPLIRALFESWRAPYLAFLPALCLSLAAIVLVVKHVKESRAPRQERGASALLNLALLGVIFIVVYVVVASPSLLKNWLLALVGIGILFTLAGVVRWLVQRIAYFKGAEVFTGRDTVLAILAGVLIGFGQAAFAYQFSTFSTNIQGVSPLVAGLRAIPFVAGALAASLVIAPLILRFGVPRIILGGMILMGLGFVGLSFIAVNTSYWFLLIPIVLFGFGFGIANPARTQVILSAPPQDLVGSAAAVNSAIGQSGFALGVGISSMLITYFAGSEFLQALKRAGVSAQILEQVRGAFADLVARLASVDYVALPSRIRDLVAIGYQEAFTSGMTQSFLAFGILMSVGAIIIYLGMRRGESAKV